MKYTSKEFAKDLSKLNSMLDAYYKKHSAGPMEGGAKKAKKATKATKSMKGGKREEGTRTFRVHTIEGRAVEPEQGGTYVISEAGNPGDAARKAFRAVCQGANREGAQHKHKNKVNIGKSKCEFVFTLQEKTRGSSHKIYGPYKGVRKNLPKPIEVKGIKGGPKIVRKHTYEVKLIELDL